MPLYPTLELSAEDASHMLNGGLLGVDTHQMRRAGSGRPRIVALIRSGRLRYDRRDPREHWQTYDELIRGIEEDGAASGDCEDLATAAAAEMRLDVGAAYHDPDATVMVYRSKPRTSHVIVNSPRFGLLDPSVGGGMGAPEGRPYRGDAFPYPRPFGYGRKRFVPVGQERRARRPAPSVGVWGRS